MKGKIYLFLKLNFEALIDLVKLFPTDLTNLWPCLMILGFSSLHYLENKNIDVNEGEKNSESQAVVSVILYLCIKLACQES